MLVAPSHQFPAFHPHRAVFPISTSCVILILSAIIKTFNPNRAVFPISTQCGSCGTSDRELSIPTGLSSPFRLSLFKECGCYYRTFNPNRAVFPISTQLTLPDGGNVGSFNPNRAVFPISTVLDKYEEIASKSFNPNRAVFPISTALEM